MVEPGMADAAAAGGLLAVAMGMMAVTVVVCLVLYVYFAFSLMTIGNKLNEDNTWLPWIPGIGAFLAQLQYAQLPWFWVLLLIGYFIPFVNIIAGLVALGLSLYCWYKIAERRGKEGWIGVLVIVPVLGLAIPGYLAFTD